MLVKLVEEQPETQATPVQQADDILSPLPTVFTIGERTITVVPLKYGPLKRTKNNLKELLLLLVGKYPDFFGRTRTEQLLIVLSDGIDFIGPIFAGLFNIEESYLDEHLDLLVAEEIILAELAVNQLDAHSKNLSRARQYLPEKLAEKLN